jgi:SAM-dependent methyltransferase
MDKTLLEDVIQMYRDQVELYGDSGIGHVLQNHNIVRRQIDAFDIYKAYLKSGTSFLDWGCRSALDAYMIRLVCSEKARIYGCDVDEETYQTFYAKSNLTYSQLRHSYELPYESEQFDLVVGSGVLEHVPNDYESLKELYRVIKPEGYFVITFLPNSKSYTEFLNKRIGNPCVHNRQYSIPEIRRMLIHTGFLPLKYGYHQLMPSFASFHPTEENVPLGFISDGLYSLDKYSKKIPFVNQFSANIFVIAQKKAVM